MTTPWTFLRACWAGLWLAGSLATAMAAEAKESTVDPTGTWKWSYAAPGGKSIEAKVKLRFADGKLTGVAIGQDKKEVPLENVRIEGDRISFKVSREVAGKAFSTRYEGKVSGKTIKGKASPAETTSVGARAWDAERVSE